MKLHKLFFAMLFLTSLTLTGAEITIQEPVAGNPVLTGSTINIKWNVSGSLNGNIKIILKCVNNPAVKRVIKENHPPNQSPVTYRIPHTIPRGNYLVRINYEGGFAVSREFPINPGLMMQHQRPVHKENPPTGIQQSVGNRQMLDHAVIHDFSVNGVNTGTTSNRIKCVRSQGISCYVRASGKPPLQYEYKITLLNPHDGYRHIVYDSSWISQNNHTIQISYSTLLDKLGETGNQIPVSVLGEIEVKVKVIGQTQNPAYRELPINFYL